MWIIIFSRLNRVMPLNANNVILPERMTVCLMNVFHATRPTTTRQRIQIIRPLISLQPVASAIHSIPDGNQPPSTMAPSLSHWVIWVWIAINAITGIIRIYQGNVFHAIRPPTIQPPTQTIFLHRFRQRVNNAIPQIPDGRRPPLITAPSP